MGNFDCCGKQISKGEQVTNIGNSMQVILVCKDCLPNYSA